jgi:hypothetical protein
MNFVELELNRVVQYQEVIFFMKNVGLIKNNVKQWKFNNDTGKMSYE